jgi:23S rRNA pseudouridine1911/1915/1917 synthase
MSETNHPESCQIILRATRPVRLLEFLCESFSDRSKKSIKSLLGQKQIMIGKRIVSRFDYPLEPGMDVLVLKKKASQNSALRRMTLLYEDEHLMVIEKSAGLLAVATETEKGETAFGILKSHVKKQNHNSQLYVVHRLDRDTSGVMMFSKSKEIQQKLQDNWDDVVTRRIYYAVVEGHVNNAEGEIVSYLKENKSLKVYSSKKTGDGKKAITRYRVLKSNSRYSLLEVALETGRKNQIRVHLHDLGHSIVGDKKYGAATNPFHRLALHAGILEFSHPITGDCMNFETPVPAIFDKLFP